VWTFRWQQFGLSGGSNLDFQVAAIWLWHVDPGRGIRGRAGGCFGSVWLPRVGARFGPDCLLATQMAPDCALAHPHDLRELTFGPPRLPKRLDSLRLKHP
ncbi:MAG: hypothetical protein ACK53L_28410, partial [Pirellulaceae bacterium]